MAIPRALLFSVLVPLVNTAALDAAAILPTVWAQGFTPELAQQFATLVGKQFGLGWTVLSVVMGVLALGAWLIFARARSTPAPIRATVFVFAVLIAALLPMGLATVALNDGLTAILLPISVTAITLAVLSKQAPQTSDPKEHAVVDVSGSRNGFGRRGT